MPTVTPFVTLRHLTVLTVAVLLTQLSSPAQTTAQPPVQSPPIHGLAHIAIRVDDIAASRAFYQKLGFEQFFSFDKDGITTQSFLKVNDRQFIELYPKVDNKPNGFLHLCFDGEDLQALYQFDVNAGLTPTPVRKAGAGNLLFTLRGPEDQNIEYTQYMSGSRHFEDRGKHLGPNRIADNFFAVALGMTDVPAAKAFYTGKLSFSTIGHSHTLLLIPGSPNQQVLLEALAAPRSRIFLLVPNLKKTAVDLKQRGIHTTSTKHQLTITDPDGNLLVFTSKQSAN